ncbi:pre-mRNA-processing factor 39 [Galendromus occidentalis]|uniref:Pre-mRNA-processing factor 39 n=1 Tax=Galendromus occidentalis TaxID=34638 RepID=A0AAJ6QUZ1_9ACAR|nr:pre-mRNA-processing factor 39 [Galendromus occidentalis]
MTTEKKEEKKSFEEMWADAKKNSGDFNGWTSLLTHVEQNVLLIGIQSAREVFLSFFEHYPYCYGYWKKLADLERKNVQEGEELAMEKCQETFEKGLQAIPLSVDLWLQYINFLKLKVKDREDEVEQLRDLYKRSIDVAGLEFRSDRLWDSWIAWETEQQQLVNVTAIYDRLISTPTQLYSQHFEKFQGLLEKYPLHETLGEEEIEEWKQLYEQRKGEGATDEDEPTFIKGEAIQRRKNVYKKNEEACTTRWTFEEGIKRPYFHVKPLEKTQIKNWKDYLDLEIEMGDEKRIRLLFERCLIACALYEDMWIKYINWVESAGDSIEAVMALYKRACEVHLPKKPIINMSWLSFVEKKEREGALAEGSVEDLLQPMEERLGSCVVFAMRRLNIHRRFGRADKVEELYKSYAASAETPKVANHFAIKYARFLVQTKGDIVTAIEILKEASQREPENCRVYLAMIDLAIKSENTVLISETFKTALKATEIPQAKKLDILQRRLEYYEEMTDEVDQAQQALEEYSKMLKLVEKERDRKRPTDENGSGPDAKKKAEEYSMAYYDRNGQSAYSAQAYSQQQWGQQGYGQAYNASQGWNGQQQAYGASYHY